MIHYRLEKLNFKDILDNYNNSMEVIKANDIIIKEQMFLIKQIFNTLDMNDVVNDFVRQKHKTSDMHRAMDFVDEKEQ